MTTVYSTTRVEPVCRGGDPGRGLAATVQDPFWMLARQRQFGELGGAGTRARYRRRRSRSCRPKWRSTAGSPAAGSVLPYAPQSDVVEALVAGEAAGPAHSALDRVQAGRAARGGAARGGRCSAAQRVRADPRARAAPRLLTRAAAIRSPGRGSQGRRRVHRRRLPAPMRRSAPHYSSRRPTRPRRAPISAAFANWCAITFGTGPSSWGARAPRTPLRARGRWTTGAERARPCA